MNTYCEEMQELYGQIVTSFVYPPIPVRNYDWEAYYDNLDDHGPVGRGGTREEAILDLLNQEVL